MPPRVAEAMDDGQKWAVGACREALLDYGWPDRPLDTERTAVILGNAMAGEQHYLTALPIDFPEYARGARPRPSFAALPGERARRRRRGAARQRSTAACRRDHRGHHAGRARQHHGRAGGQPASTSAARTSSSTPRARRRMAALDAAIEGLARATFDAVLTGGVDSQHGVPAPS